MGIQTLSSPLKPGQSLENDALDRSANMAALVSYILFKLGFYALTGWIIWFLCDHI